MINRAMRNPDFIGVDSPLIETLRSYVQADVSEVTTVVAKFFKMVISEAPLLESFEIDNIILRNGVPLAAWCVSYCT